ncbi:hypothetical protein [Synechococcus sp. N26]|uniref:hypothetical protein n=1 Tax=Synechococcus sp. N26 TaxID=2575513 RepID=UPI000E0FDD67|nr:hypothetical protein [Synechococcus sp. N26]
MLFLAELYAIASFVLRLLGLKQLGKKARGRASEIRAEFWKSAEEQSQRIKEAEQEWEDISRLTPEKRAELWKAGKLNVQSYNRRKNGWSWYPRAKPKQGYNPDQVFTVPRVGRYRINSKGRKVYDV